MVGGADRIRIADDLDAGDAIAKCRRHEHVVEPNVRIPCRHREARITGMGRAERIDVSRIRDRLNRPPFDSASAEPHERPQPRRQPSDVEIFSRRPFFLLISVDAPITVRWERFKNRSAAIFHC